MDNTVLNSELSEKYSIFRRDRNHDAPPKFNEGRVLIAIKGTIHVEPVFYSSGSLYGCGPLRVSPPYSLPFIWYIRLLSTCTKNCLAACQGSLKSHSLSSLSASTGILTFTYSTGLIILAFQFVPTTSPTLLLFSFMGTRNCLGRTLNLFLCSPP